MDSIGDLARTVKRILKSSGPIVHIPYDEAYGEGFEDMQKRVPDLSKVQKLIGYMPRFGLEEIILEVAEYEGRRAARAVSSK